MRNTKNNNLNQLFWIEFVIMVGILLLVVVMTLVGMKKAHQMNKNNEMQIETNIALQNIMEYCKVNRTNIEMSIQQLGGILDEESKNYSRLIVYYDSDWKEVVPFQEAAHSIELTIHTTEYTYGKLRDIVLEGHDIEHYSVEQHGTKGNGKKLSLTLEGSCIIGEGEI